jgi:hypothetical protein
MKREAEQRDVVRGRRGVGDDQVDGDRAGIDRGVGAGLWGDGAAGAIAGEQVILGAGAGLDVLAPEIPSIVGALVSKLNSMFTDLYRSGLSATTTAPSSLPPSCGRSRWAPSRHWRLFCWSKHQWPPSQDLLVIRRNHQTGAVSLDALRWGLIPYFATRREQWPLRAQSVTAYSADLRSLKSYLPTPWTIRNRRSLVPRFEVWWACPALIW